MTKPLSIAVLVSSGRNPISSRPRACNGDAVALAIGQALSPGHVRVLHAGSTGEPALQDYLALGAGHIGVVQVPTGGDVTPALCAVLSSVDLVLTGTCAETGAGSGLLPYLIGAALDRPVIENALSLQLADGGLHVRQFLPQGKRRTIIAPVPAVVAVHSSAPASLGYAYARQRSGVIEELRVDVASGGKSAEPWTVEPEPRLPQRLKADSGADGHTRMLSYIESPAKAGVVAFEGTSVDKAQVLLSYLRDHRLVDF
jgi:electron transfer flavoprotein beta subunit